MAKDKIKADQNGAQDRGNAAQGNNNKLNQGTNSEFSLNGVGGNATITNGISGDQFSDILGKITAPSTSSVQAATPPAVTGAAAAVVDAAAADDKKKYLIYAVAGLALLLGLLRFFKK